MKTKEEIVANWLPRYTKRNLEDFGEYILLTNFNKYVSVWHGMPAASACTACARPISNPSGVAYELSDMFCALNGAGR